MRALWIAAQRFKRTLLRALDYLPPGDVTFADLGRAIIASDQASHPDSGRQREWLKAEFVKRGIVAAKKELEVKTNYRHPAVAGLDLEELVRSDWLAYEFANRARSLLTIPPSIPFKVRAAPRRDQDLLPPRAQRAVGAGVPLQGLVDRDRAERRGVGGHAPAAAPPRHDPGHRLGDAKRARRGDDGEPHGRARASERRARDGMLTRLAAGDELRIGPEAYGPDGMLLRGAVPAEIVRDTLAVRGVARTLHVTRGV